MLIFIFLSVLSSFRPAEPTDSLLIVSWNVENFLDPRTDTTGRYTYSRFRSKCNAISKTILLIAAREGRLPDAVALMEVGNRYVLERLLHDTPLRKLDYSIVHYDSPDRRGIDCALLYRRSSLRLLNSGPRHLYDSSGALMHTRDILLAEFDGIDILVNHHPSKVGADSERRRAVAMARLQELMDSCNCHRRPVMERSDTGGVGGYAPRPLGVQGDSSRLRRPVMERSDTGGAGGYAPRPLGVQGDSSRHRRPVMAVGDFNDDIWPHKVPRKATEGTIKYNGSWEKIDGHFALGDIYVRESVFSDPCLSEPDRAFGGLKPRRSFYGPRWLGGASDHYPIILWITKTAGADAPAVR
jgi:hypothetical protein